MQVRCRFCGQKIPANSERCEHCGKNLEPTKASNSTIDVWQSKTVPAWVMYLTLLLGVGCLILMFSRGCDPPIQETEQDASRLRINFAQRKSSKMTISSSV